MKAKLKSGEDQKKEIMRKMADRRFVVTLLFVWYMYVVQLGPAIRLLRVK